LGGGIELDENLGQLAVTAIIFGLVNALIKPILSIVSCPINILTLGLFTLVINALMLMLTAYFAPGLAVEGFWNAFLGALIISIVSTLLSFVLVDNDRKK
jgi:putative membrane protein